MHLRLNRRHSPSQAMRFFPIFFFVALLPLSHIQGKFRCSSSATRKSEAATGGVL